MRTDIQKDEFSVCTISDIITSCSDDCRTCQIACDYMHKLSTIKDSDNIPDRVRVSGDVKFKLNSTDTIAEYKSLRDALVTHTSKYSGIAEFVEVGYSLAIIKRYPLFARLKRTLGLPIPKRILWSSNKNPLVVVYDDCVYAISSILYDHETSK